MNNLNSIQILRAIAAMLVVLHHSSNFAVRYNGDGLLLEGLNSGIGAIGVDIFFILSGFLMAFTTRNKGIKPLLFLQKRFVRVIPTYVFYTLSLGALLFLIPNLFSNLRWEPYHFILSLLLIPHTSPSGDYLPLLGVGWTLIFEVIFYFIFSVSLLFSQKRQIFIASLIILFLIFIGTLAPSKYIEFKFFWFLTNPMLIEFVFGFLAYKFFKLNNEIFVNKYIKFFSLILCVIFSYFVSEYVSDKYIRVLLWGVPSLIVFIVMLDFKFRDSNLVNKLLIKIGDSSYSLYLSHMFILPIIWKIFNGFDSTFVIFFSLFVCVFLAYFLYVFIEVKLTSLFNKLIGVKCFNKRVYGGI